MGGSVFRGESLYEAQERRHRELIRAIMSLNKQKTEVTKESNTDTVVIIDGKKYKLLEINE